jgi:hypothetical protein
MNYSSLYKDDNFARNTLIKFMNKKILIEYVSQKIKLLNSDYAKEIEFVFNYYDAHKCHENKLSIDSIPSNFDYRDFRDLFNKYKINYIPNMTSYENLDDTVHASFQDEWTFFNVADNEGYYVDENNIPRFYGYIDNTRKKMSVFKHLTDEDIVEATNEIKKISNLCDEIVENLKSIKSSEKVKYVLYLKVKSSANNSYASFFWKKLKEFKSFFDSNVDASWNENIQMKYVMSDTDKYFLFGFYESFDDVNKMLHKYTMLMTEMKLSDCEIVIDDVQNVALKNTDKYLLSFYYVTLMN